MVNKEEAVLFSRTLAKYGLALCSLHPSQMNELQDSLSYFRKTTKIPDIGDSFTRLAFMMIVSDLIWQEEQQKGGQKNDC